ncbi:alpha/beta fold hydrolase [Thermogemmatispora sp.]|uniref:alpha/beta fold hydrolase n=1 Tax=Thermogemmatispora sp. TaxID=1968838 RepID=UPI0035E43E6C
MKNALSRLKWLLRLSALVSLLAGLGASLAIVWHRLVTPQLLESALPGQARLYRWRHGHIFYTLAGPEKAPPLVLWHAPGLAASAYELRELATLLAERYRVYAPDLLGFGLSDRPALPYNGSLYTDLVSDFLREVVGEPALLVARGASCQYVLEAAQRIPERCRGLVLLWPEQEAGLRWQGLPWLRELLASLAHLPLLGLLTFCLLTTRVALRSLLAAGQSRSDLDYGYATTHQFGAEHAVLAWLSGELRAERDGSRWAAVASLPYPVLVVQADSGRRGEEASSEPQGQTARAELLRITSQGYTVDRQAAALISARLSEWPAPPRSSEEASGRAPGAGQGEEADPPAESEPATSASAEVPTPSPAETASAIEAYCLKCKQKSLMLNVSETILKNGRPALQGTCARCGTRMYRIGRR